MARLIGGKPHSLSKAENLVYSFISKELPDYITAGFCIKVEGCELDVILLVPHIGIFILEVKEGMVLSHNGNQFMIGAAERWNRFNPLQTKKYRHMMVEYMRKNFHINPLVYEINCFPMLNIDDNIRFQVQEIEDHFMFREDFSNGRTFLLKLFKYYTASMHFGEADDNGENDPLFYDDIDDELVYEITHHWGGELVKKERPQKPPYLFLSYNRNNQTTAKNIQAELEKRGVFTWKAPMDVPFGEDYLEHEMKAIEECNAFVLLLSAASQESNEVKLEFEKAIETNKKIFPIVLGEFDINTYYLSALKRIEWREFTEEDWGFLDEIVEVFGV